MFKMFFIFKSIDKGSHGSTRSRNHGNLRFRSLTEANRKVIRPNWCRIIVRSFPTIYLTIFTLPEILKIAQISWPYFGPFFANFVGRSEINPRPKIRVWGPHRFHWGFTMQMFHFLKPIVKTNHLGPKHNSHFVLTLTLSNNFKIVDFINFDIFKMIMCLKMTPYFLRCSRCFLYSNP